MPFKLQPNFSFKQPVFRTPTKPGIFLCLCALLAGMFSMGQDPSSGHVHSIKPTTDFDQRFYYMPQGIQNIWGYRVGMLINDRYKLGIGGYYMDEDSEGNNASSGPFTRTSNPVSSHHERWYLGTLYYEPYLLRRELWEISLVVEAGYGRKVNFDVDSASLEKGNKNNTLICPAALGLSFNFKLPPLFHINGFHWFGLNAMGGYRKILYQQDKASSNNGAYWSLSGAVFLDRILDDYHAMRRRQAARKGKVIELHY